MINIPLPRCEQLPARCLPSTTLAALNAPSLTHTHTPLQVETETKAKLQAMEGEGASVQRNYVNMLYLLLKMRQVGGGRWQGGRPLAAGAGCFFCPPPPRLCLPAVCTCCMCLPYLHPQPVWPPHQLCWKQLPVVCMSPNSQPPQLPAVTAPSSHPPLRPSHQACNHPWLVRGGAATFGKSAQASAAEINAAKKLPAERQRALVDAAEAHKEACPVCLDAPDDAVITLCGHIYCR
jgi:hypothetical protein